MTKLSDTQAIILSAAAQREDRIALPLPESLRGGAASKVVGAMLAKGFLEEVDANMRNGEPVWRETGDGMASRWSPRARVSPPSASSPRTRAPRLRAHWARRPRNLRWTPRPNRRRLPRRARRARAPNRPP